MGKGFSAKQRAGLDLSHVFQPTPRKRQRGTPRLPSTKRQLRAAQQRLQAALKDDPELREEVKKMKLLRDVIAGRVKPDNVAELPDPDIVKYF